MRAIPAAAAIAVAGTLPAAAAVSGFYVEVRTADVWTGPCYANAQVGLEGKEAILGLSVAEGSFEGVSLGGLAAAVVVEAGATLGDPDADAAPTRALLLVDERASAQQRAALARLVGSLVGPLVEGDLSIAAAPIELEVGGRSGRARLEAGEVARLETRPLDPTDHRCGNEEVYYPPLGAVEGAVPAATVVAAYTGSELGRRWRVAGTKGAFVGAFRR